MNDVTQRRCALAQSAALLNFTGTITTQKVQDGAVRQVALLRTVQTGPGKRYLGAVRAQRDDQPARALKVELIGCPAVPGLRSG